MTRRSVVAAIIAPSLLSETLRAIEARFQMRYEDFPKAGLVLVRPSSPDYESLVSQIKARSLRTLAQSDAVGLRATGGGFDLQEDLSKSVVFSNQSEKAVSLLQVLWGFELPDGRETIGSCAWAGAESLLLPFELTSGMKSAMKYRSAILPGSKRYITNAGVVIGDNSDVRPPSTEEIWRGGMVSGFGGGYTEPRHVARLSICIEGAFFDNGEFVGTNRSRLFEQIVAKANAPAKIAEMANQKGRSTSSILDDIQRTARKVKATDWPPLIPEANTPISVYGQMAFRDLAENVQNYRTSKGDARTLEIIRSWATIEVPVFRKLAVTVSSSAG